MKNPWLDLILSGKKKWVIRGEGAKMLGKIHLALSGAVGLILGQCRIVDSFPVTRKKLRQKSVKHCIKDLSILSYTRPHAWDLEKPLRYAKPFVYTHKPGSGKWVIL